MLELPPPPHAERPAIKATKTAIKGVVKAGTRRRGIDIFPFSFAGMVRPGYNTALRTKLCLVAKQSDPRVIPAIPGYCFTCAKGICVTRAD